MTYNDSPNGWLCSVEIYQALQEQPFDPPSCETIKYVICMREHEQLDNVHFMYIDHTCCPTCQCCATPSFMAGFFIKDLTYTWLFVGCQSININVIAIKQFIRCWNHEIQRKHLLQNLYISREL